MDSRSRWILKVGLPILPQRSLDNQGEVLLVHVDPNSLLDIYIDLYVNPFPHLLVVSGYPIGQISSVLGTVRTKGAVITTIPALHAYI